MSESWKDSLSEKTASKFWYKYSEKWGHIVMIDNQIVGVRIGWLVVVLGCVEKGKCDDWGLQAGLQARISVPRSQYVPSD